MDDPVFVAASQAIKTALAPEVGQVLDDGTRKRIVGRVVDAVSHLVDYNIMANAEMYSRREGDEHATFAMRVRKRRWKACYGLDNAEYLAILFAPAGNEG